MRREEALALASAVCLGVGSLGIAIVSHAYGLAIQEKRQEAEEIRYRLGLAERNLVEAQRLNEIGLLCRNHGAMFEALGHGEKSLSAPCHPPNDQLSQIKWQNSANLMAEYTRLATSPRAEALGASGPLPRTAGRRENPLYSPRSPLQSLLYRST